jgi:hypothetical protein
MKKASIALVVTLALISATGVSAQGYPGACPYDPDPIGIPDPGHLTFPPGTAPFSGDPSSSGCVAGPGVPLVSLNAHLSLIHARVKAAAGTLELSLKHLMNPKAH